jgi:hypothetical protein
MKTYQQMFGALSLADDVVIGLRGDGYAAYVEVDRGLRFIVTNAPLSLVLLIAGHGQAFQRI